MINERVRHICRRLLAGRCFSATHNQVPSCDSGRGETMTSAMTALAIAVGGTSPICYLLMTRLQNRRANRGSSGHSPAPDGGNFAGGDGWSIFTWFGGDNSASDSSGNPGDSAGSNSGGGGDGGGGGGDGGGAGD
jgi:hypothetical protein